MIDRLLSGTPTRDRRFIAAASGYKMKKLIGVKGGCYVFVNTKIYELHLQNIGPNCQQYSINNRLLIITRL